MRSNRSTTPSNPNSDNPCIAHFRRYHSVLPTMGMLFPEWMQNHAFLVTLSKAGNPRTSGLELFERWHAELVERLNDEASSFMPVVFVTEKARRGRTVHGVLLLPLEAFEIFARLKARNQLRLIDDVSAVELRAYDRRVVERRFARSPLNGWMWTSYPHIFHPSRLIVSGHL